MIASIDSQFRSCDLGLERLDLHIRTTTGVRLTASSLWLIGTVDVTRYRAAMTDGHPAHRVTPRRSSPILVTDLLNRRIGRASPERSIRGATCLISRGLQA